MGKFKLQNSKKKKVVKKSEPPTPSLEELKRTLGFPDSTEFLGYAVYLEQSDEFLAEFDDSPKQGVTKKVWAKTPQLAAYYNTLATASKISQECSGSIVIGLFDTGDQILSVTMSVNR
jgi:hypothetical protein